MSDAVTPEPPEPTPVNDVRRVRERFNREAGGDINNLIEESNRFFEMHREKLRLKLVRPPRDGDRRTGTQG
jgi:hypothetical protein